jgi:hypothetical protein
MTNAPKTGIQTFYCRFRGATTGRVVRTWDRVTAQRLFCAQENVPVSSYITICFKPTKGVVYTN